MRYMPCFFAPCYIFVDPRPARLFIGVWGIVVFKRPAVQVKTNGVHIHVAQACVIYFGVMCSGNGIGAGTRYRMPHHGEAVDFHLRL